MLFKVFIDTIFASLLTSSYLKSKPPYICDQNLFNKLSENPFCFSTSATSNWLVRKKMFVKFQFCLRLQISIKRVMILCFKTGPFQETFRVIMQLG